MANKTFPDFVAEVPQATVQPGDLIPVVQGGVTKKAEAGQPGGVPILDANGKVIQDPASRGQPGGLAELDADGRLAQAVGYAQWTGLSSTSTTAEYTNGLSIAFTALRSGSAILTGHLEVTRQNGTPRAAAMVFVNGSEISGRKAVGFFTQENAVFLTPTYVFPVNKNDQVELRFGLWPGQADGTNELKFWTPYAYLIEFGGDQ